jgi:hypothetical protein
MLSLYTIISLTTSFLLFGSIAKKKSLLIKPSIWFLMFFNIQIQWAAVYNFHFITLKIQDQSIFFILTQVFPLIAVGLCLKSFNKSSSIIWNRLLQINNHNYINKLVIVRLIIISLIIILIYLLFVPFSKTGLYNNFKAGGNPLDATIARENSLKLLTSTWLKYLFVFYQQSIALFTTSLLFIHMFFQFKEHMYLNVLKYTALVIFIMLGAMLPGERISGVLILLSIFITYLFIEKGKLNVIRITLILVIVLTPALLIQIKKYNLSINTGTIATVFQTVLLDRILSVPLKTGVTWIFHVEHHGYWGILGIPKLAEISGYSEINIPNLMMKEYFDVGTIDTGYLNTSFVFAYFSYFKWFAIPFLFMFVYILDYVVLFYKTLKPNLLLPAIVTINLSCLSLISSDYTTLFLSHGFLTTVVLAYTFNKLVKQ